MGRNRVYEEGKTQVGLYLNEEELKVFEEIRRREGKTKSELAHIAVEEYLKIHGDGNSSFTIEQFQDPDFKAMPATMSPMMDWKKFIMNNTNKQEREELELRARSIIGVITDKNKADMVEKWSKEK